MFQSVIEQQEWRARRLGTGAGVSVVVHAGILAAAMVLSAGVAQEVQKEPPEVKMYVAAPRATPIPPSTPKAPEPPKPKPPKTNSMAVPTKIPTTTPPEAPPTPETQNPPEDLPYHPDGDPDSEVDTVPCPTCIAIKGLVPTNVEPTGEDVIPYVQGTMTTPKFLEGARIEYTHEARQMGVAGLLIARCVITQEGEVENCKIIKGQPHMNEAVLAALKTWRYTPVMYQGKPTSVMYNFNVNLKMDR